MNLAITMDVTNRCNSRCKICYFSLPGFKPKGRDMTMAEFKLVAQQLACHSGRLSISCEFEPLLHQDIEAILMECKRLAPEWQIRVNTNGISLSESVSKALVESGVAEIYVSIDAPTQEMNSRIRGNSALPRILKELKTLADIKKTSERTTPVCIIRSTAMMANLHQLPDMIALAASVGAERFSVKHLIPIEGCEWDGHAMAEQSCLLSPEETRFVFDHIREQGNALGIAVDLPPASPANESTLKISCGYVNNGFHIFPDGTCFPCVWLTAGESYGNIYRDNVETLLSSTTRIRFRNAFPHPGTPEKCLACLRDSQTVGHKIQDNPRVRLEQQHA
jgi:radical SAM protein with 4Fe4S-binding SPASM domain